jgi:hypothetical protein
MKSTYKQTNILGTVTITVCCLFTDLYQSNQLSSSHSTIKQR